MACLVYGYGQASHDPHVPSTDAQESYLREMCATLTHAGRLVADTVWAGFFCDDATSKPTAFRERHGGSLLLAHLKPGSVVLVTSSDRMFTRVVDACETLLLAHDMGFRLIILDYGVDTGAPHELLMPLVTMMKNLVESENEWRRGRTKETFDCRKHQGLPAGGKAPIGWELVRAKVGASDRAYFIPDHAARRLAHFICEHYDRWGGTFEQTTHWLNAQKIRRPDGKKWKRTAVRNWYHAAKAGFPLPNGQRQAFPVPANAEPVKRGRYIEPDVCD